LFASPASTRRSFASSLTKNAKNWSYPLSAFFTRTPIESREIVSKTSTEQVTLDPADPFDSALIPIVEMHRRKRADYAKDGTPFDNFETSSSLMGLDGFGPAESALFNVTQKLARLKSLRQNGRMHDPQNEAVLDTYLDLAVYGILAYAIYRSRL